MLFIEYTQKTNWFLVTFAFLAAFALVIDWVHSNEPVENVGDDFGFSEDEVLKHNRKL